MPLVPRSDQQSGQPKTKAGKLRALHAAFSKKESRQADFTKLLKRYSFEDIEKTLIWLGKQPSQINQIDSKELGYRFAFLRGECEQDLSGYALTQEAHDVLEKILEVQEAEPIPVEYVQHAIDRYRELSKWLSHDADHHAASLLAEKMLPAKEFVYVWFTRIVPSYSKKFRKFHHNHPKFQQIMLRLSQEIGTPRAWITLSVQFDGR